MGEPKPVFIVEEFDHDPAKEAEEGGKSGQGKGGAKDRKRQYRMEPKDEIVPGVTPRNWRTDFDVVPEEDRYTYVQVSGSERGRLIEVEGLKLFKIGTYQNAAEIAGLMGFSHSLHATTFCDGESMFVPFPSFPFPSFPSSLRASDNRGVRQGQERRWVSAL